MPLVTDEQKNPICLLSNHHNNDNSSCSSTSNVCVDIESGKDDGGNENEGLLASNGNNCNKKKKIKRGAAPITESSRLPRFVDFFFASPSSSSSKNNNNNSTNNEDWSKYFYNNSECECCICVGGICICCFGLIYLGLFIMVCILLSEANNQDVHTHCGDFWNFMLVSILFPVLLPLIFCLVRPCIGISWLHFTAASTVIMAIASFCTAYHAGSEFSCVEALRRSSPPDPLLMYLDYVNGGLFSFAAISAISKQVHIDSSRSSSMPKT